jgi:hypothetical protein
VTDVDTFKLSLINHTPTPETVAQIERIREAAKQFGLTVFREAPASRERSLAITKIEEAVMWAVKSAALPRQGVLV